MGSGSSGVCHKDAGSSACPAEKASDGGGDRGKILLACGALTAWRLAEDEKS